MNPPSASNERYVPCRRQVIGQTEFDELGILASVRPKESGFYGPSRLATS
jgi:hypothetical protein